MTLLVPVALLLAVLLFVAHGHSRKHDHERRRVARLLDASGHTARLRSFEDALSTAAQQVRLLVDAAGAFCCAIDASGQWYGMMVDERGVRPANGDAVETLRELAAEDSSAREIDLTDRLLNIRLALPPARTLLLAVASVASGSPVILGAYAERRPSIGESDRAQMLGRFAPQADLSVANARLYEEVDNAYRQQLDLNRQKGEFVATVSHELRTPVAAIIGTIETISRLGSRLDDDRRAKLLEGAVDYGERLSRLIEELLLVAAAEQSATTVRVDNVDLEDLVNRVVHETAAVTDGRVMATVKAVNGRVCSDEPKLQRVLVNLIENAAKYAPEGSIELEAMAAGARLLFFVTDHGPGIAAADRERVFERFVQLDQSLTRRQGGLGLGLYLCRQLAGLLGGEIVLTDTPGGGACFCLAVDRDLPVPADQPEESEATSGSGGVLRRPTAPPMSSSGKRLRLSQVAR
ncbi:MAG TPA: HAMP domain-containing sensor histidine kinase [Acidimicrobiales bacterium]